MNISPTTQKTNAATCPHGNPIGTCPICNGMGTGGGGLSSNKPRKAGEMTYDQCYAIWQQMLKAKATAEEQKQIQKLEYINAQAKIQSFTDKIMDKINSIIHKGEVLNSQNKLNSTITSRIHTFLINSTIVVFNTLKAVINIIHHTINFGQKKFTDISDKLNAIFGELKLAIKKRLSEKFNFKTKFKSIFHIFKSTNIQNEERKIDEEKLLFRLKTTLNKIKEKYTKTNIKR